MSTVPSGNVLAMPHQWAVLITEELAEAEEMYREFVQANVAFTVLPAFELELC